MQYQENARIERFINDAGDTWGMIELKHIANPDSMIVTLCGERLYPEKYNIFGWPIFTNEVCNRFYWKKEELERKYGKDFQLKALVSYDELKVEIKEEDVNSLEGIKTRVGDLDSLNQLLKDRCIYYKSQSEDKRLNKYILFGKYEIDNFAQIWELVDEEQIDVPDVCTPIEFENAFRRAKNGKNCSRWTASSVIPKEGECCPWCTKRFTIEDVKKGKFGIINGKTAHDSCRKEYEHEREINKIINQLMAYIYKEGLTYEILPNGYWGSDASHIPWFMCHTPDGDIKIGWRKRVISIEWQDNFKPFDISIFNSENVTKWVGDINIYNNIVGNKMPTSGKRGIHAWGRDKAYEYLEKVRDIVNQ